VVTVSLGVLKARHAATFVPALPAGKADSIRRLRIGVVDKIFVDFVPEEGVVEGQEEGAGGVLPEDCHVITYALLWPDSEGEREALSDLDVAPLPAWARGIFSIRFGGPEFKRRGPGGPHLGGARAGDAGAAWVEDDEGEHEKEEGGGADEAAPAAGDAPLHRQAVVWLVGADAGAMEAASDEGVLAAQAGVAAWFPGVRPPGGASWARTRVLRSRWGADPRGSYSYVGAGGPLEDVAALAAPVQAQRGGGGGARTVLAFAGEACSLRYIGTTHGAFLTGEQQGEALLEENRQRWGLGAPTEPSA
jgi:spermine oxidase